MIYIKFYKHRDKTEGFEIKGHSNLYNKLWHKIANRFKIKKKDYICSAVSAVAYMTVINLNKVLKKRIRFDTKNSGFMKCELLDKPDKETENIFRAFELTLQEIDKEYPGNIKIT